MLGVGGAAAVAEKHQLAAAADGRNTSRHQSGESRGQRAFRLAGDVVVLGEFTFEERGDVHLRYAASPRNSGTASRNAW